MLKYCWYLRQQTGLFIGGSGRVSYSPKDCSEITFKWCVEFFFESAARKSGA